MRRLATGIVRRLATVVLLLGVGLEALAAGDAFTLAVLPGAPPVTMHKLWTPVVDHLKQATGLDFRLKLYERMAEFERDIWDGNPDFMFGSPIQLVVAHQSAGYVPLVRGGQLVNIGLFVRKDSPVRSIDDLIGRKIAFVGNKNICSVFIQHELASYKRKLDFETEYAGSTRNVIINVLMGKSDAGAVFRPELEREPAETQGQLRQVVTTPDFAPHPIAAHPRVPPAVQEAVKQAVLAMATTTAGAELLKSLRLQDPVVADYGRDYRALEAIDIKRLTNWGR